MEPANSETQSLPPDAVSQAGMEGTHINRLPDEVLEVIFLYLSQRDILASVVPVCQCWQAITQARILNKHLTLCHDFNNDVSAKEALRLVKDIPNLQSLRVAHRADTAELLTAASLRCRQLRRLVVERYRSATGVALTAALRTVLSSCSEHLTELSLKYIDVADSLELFEGLGTALSNLRRLSLSGCRWFGPAAFDAVLEGCLNIEDFKVNTPCSYTNVAKLAQRWGHSLQVLELELDLWQVTDAGLAALAGCSQLRSLRLSSLQTHGAWLHQLASLAHLTEFRLVSSDTVQPQNICKFVTQSQSAHQLQIISFNQCSMVDDSVMTAVAAECPSLEDMDVFSCPRVTAKGVQKLLRCCCQLLQLEARKTDRSVAQLEPEIPQLAPQLRRLEIDDLMEASYLFWNNRVI